MTNDSAVCGNDESSAQEHPEHVARLLIKHRSSLLAFIFAVMRDFDAAEDTLQDVSVAIWENADTFELGSNFGAWARSIARRRIAAYWRTRSRSGQTLSDEQIDQLVDGFEQLQSANEPEPRKRALVECLGHLSPLLTRLIHLRYSKQLSLADVAESVGQPTETIRKALYRGRTALRECIERKLALNAEAGSVS
ncbi:RNA polymerase sigma-70 factor (ECF subfamily) [Rhodopirellula rubra]|uniref:RNA polymerase sigma-70 factor (ECF subfamily) n=1 Tax=Aporhodopirellula rubra TaxID=980271 RepID=A0A7W5H581_9BACT|nr:sigma-70 family RNA polymerase sigma factor [Aporhodopirellula rubra]MBB3206169.1 RNA polymerase sigma-70 factor (ECF subfamily) [Aporhodopirellula rubra]